jgi:hypothetical protein
MDDQEEHIRHRAYALWQAAGEPEGRASEFWLLALNEISRSGQAAYAGDKPGTVREGAAGERAAGETLRKPG